MGSNKTTLTLASLRSQTTYVVLVSAHTAEGAGPTSDPISDQAETTTYGCKRIDKPDTNWFISLSYLSYLPTRDTSELETMYG